MKKTYTRPKSLLPLQSGFCPGCLHGTAAKITSEVLDELQQGQNALLVLPVGCATMGLLYWKVDMIGSAHGRAPAVATGAKRSHPSSLVFTYQGDGDLAAIGLGEILSAANRGENITVIFANNATYGMTGGQMAPTTLIGQKSTTSRVGRNAESEGYPIPMCELIKELKAPAFVARYALDTPQNIKKARAGIKKAFECQLENKGFSFVELLTNCPTNWGMSPLQSLEYMQTHTIPAYPLGIFKDKEADKS